MGAQGHHEIIRWRVVGACALAATVLITVGLLSLIRGPGEGDPLVVILPGSEGPSAQAFREDFPRLEFVSEMGHDGQQVYAVARNPWHLEEAAPHLDRPTYRLGRPLLSWLGWALHPSGGGRGLAWSLITVEVLAVFGFAVAGGALVQLCGGRPWLAAAFPFLPGTMATVAITTSDVLATGLFAGSVAAALRRRFGLSAGLGALAILAKESVGLPLGVVFVAMAFTQARGDGCVERLRTLVCSREIAAGAATFVPWLVWSAWIRVQLGAETRLVEFGPPFGGVLDAWQLRWSQGRDVVALVTVSLTYVLAAWAVVQARRSPRVRPLWWALIVQVLFTSTFAASVVALDYNGTRTTLPLLVLALAVAVGAKEHEGAWKLRRSLSRRRPTPV